jgi:hypothetical protein
MLRIGQVAPRLHELAWSAVRGPAADPWGSADGTRAERRAGALELLAIYSKLVKVLQRRIDLTIKDALDAGADYGEIATACGVSRQAVRQRWLRRSQGASWFEVPLPSPRPHGQISSRADDSRHAAAIWVRLAGGPHDGGRDLVQADAVLRYEVDKPPTGSSGTPALLAWYVPSHDDDNVYVFAGVETTARGIGVTPLRGTGRAVRVYELAAELGVDSKVLMTKLEEMGEFVRSAASPIARPAARVLREQFAPQVRNGPRGPDRELT